MIKLRNLLTEDTIMDKSQAEELKSKLNNQLDAEFVQATISTLGGELRPAVMLKLSLDPRGEWQNNIFENSRFMHFSVSHDGAIEQFNKSYQIEKKFRKARFKTIDDVVKKINIYLKSVK